MPTDYPPRIPILYKRLSSNLDYGVNWGEEWLQAGEVVSTSDWTVPAGLSGTNQGNDGQITSIWLGGGVVNTNYEVTNSIVSSNSRVDSRKFILSVIPD